MGKFIVLAIACTLLNGCVSMEKAAQDECFALGAQPGTPTYINCYQQSMARRQSAVNAAVMSN